MIKKDAILLSDVSIQLYKGEQKKLATKAQKIE